MIVEWQRNPDIMKVLESVISNEIDWFAPSEWPNVLLRLPCPVAPGGNPKKAFVSSFCNYTRVPSLDYQDQQRHTSWEWSILFTTRGNLQGLNPLVFKSQVSCTAVHWSGSASLWMIRPAFKLWLDLENQVNEFWEPALSNCSLLN